MIIAPQLASLAFMPGYSAPAIHVVLGYIDPGTGSMMFQMLLAALLSAGVAFKSVRQRIAFAWHSFRKPAIPGDSGAPTPPADDSTQE